MPHSPRPRFRSDRILLAVRALADLERCRSLFGPGLARRKLALLQALARSSLRSAQQVRRLHEALCFVRAYPDDARVLRQASRMLDGFDRRPDLIAHREELAYSGIAGTTLWFPYFYPTARWIATRWPALLTLDRTDLAAGRSIAKLLPALLSPLEAHALRESHLAGYEALDRLRGARTDATFLVERVASMPGSETTREAFYDLINPSCELAACARHAVAHTRVLRPCAARVAIRTPAQRATRVACRARTTATVAAPRVTTRRTRTAASGARSDDHAPARPRRVCLGQRSRRVARRSRRRARHRADRHAARTARGAAGHLRRADAAKRRSGRLSPVGSARAIGCVVVQHVRHVPRRRIRVCLRRGWSRRCTMRST